ncbi:hypothetical protein ACGC1H_005827 [Rhizoctonia solani]
MIGFSWVNTHLSSANVIYGYEIFWRRILLVLVGCCASFILMMLTFPPQSAHRAVRLGDAMSISEISQIDEIPISSWLRVEEDSTEIDTPDATSKLISHPQPMNPRI